MSAPSSQAWAPPEHRDFTELLLTKKDGLSWADGMKKAMDHIQSVSARAYVQKKQWNEVESNPF